MNKPDFIIIGAQKAGTTAAAYNLNKHPSIFVFSGVTEYGQSEIEFFNQHWDRGSDWYQSHFSNNNTFNGEKTAELLHRTICHKRIYIINPNVKLLVLLRCPIQRAYSQWRMATFNKGDETRTFEEVIDAELMNLKNYEFKKRFYACKVNDISNWREGYVMKGFYFEQLKSLCRYFSIDKIHITITEQLIDNMNDGYNSIFSFLNVSPYSTSFEKRFIGKRFGEINDKTIKRLKLVYKEHNERLFEFLGYRVLEWNY